MRGYKSEFYNYFANKVWQLVLLGRWISAEHMPVTNKMAKDRITSKITSINIRVITVG